MMTENRKEYLKRYRQLKVDARKRYVDALKKEERDQKMSMRQRAWQKEKASMKRREAAAKACDTMRKEIAELCSRPFSWQEGR